MLYLLKGDCLADEELCKEASMGEQIRCSLMRCAFQRFQSSSKAVHHSFVEDALAELSTDEARLRRAVVSIGFGLKAHYIIIRSPYT